MRHRAYAGLTILAYMIASLLLASPAHAQAKHAFVVGIDDYDATVGPLGKAVSDARAVATTFKAVGFAPTLVVNRGADRLKLLEQWGAFVRTVREGDTVAFYFSGHGMQIGQTNYLLPRDMLETAHGAGVATNFAVSLAQIVDDLAARKPRLVFLIIDACRNNPFNDPTAKKAYGLKSGLAEVKDPPRGTFIMYSAGANELALDWLTDPDPDPNSVYTRHLLKLLATPGLSLVDIATRVREAVALDARTKHVVKGRHVTHRQVPAYYDGLDSNYVLVEGERKAPPEVKVAAAPQAAPPAVPRIEPQASAPQPPSQPLPCDDAAFAQAHAANTREAFEAYLPKAAPECAAATRLALRDLRQWDAIEKAGGLQAAKGTRSAPRPAGSPVSAGSPAPAGLREQIQSYLTENDFKPAPRKAGEATALLRQIETSERMASCAVYAPAAVKLGKENVDQACGFRGEEWDTAVDIQQSWCLDPANGPEKATARLKVREAELARCKRAKTDKADWEKVVALKLSAPASDAAGKRSRAVSQSETAYLAALNDYIKRYEPDGAFLAVARQELASATSRAREAACKTFAAAAVVLAARNQEDPACKLEGAAWVRDEASQVKACLEIADDRRDAELKTRTAAIDACTWAKRNEEAWQEASRNRTTDELHGYIVTWKKGPHIAEAVSQLRSLCEPSWPDARKGDNWSKLSLFAIGSCQLTSHRDEAERLRKALDERLWKTAKDQGSKSGFETYLKRTGAREDNTGVRDCFFGECGSGAHAEEAAREIADFRAWEGASKAKASCGDVAEYLQNFEKGRFKSVARTKLREAIRVEEAKAKATAERFRSKTKDPTDLGWIRDPITNMDADCKQFEHLLSDSQRALDFHPEGRIRQ